MIKILHIADVHIFNTTRHVEYREQFEKLYKVVQKNNIDIVVIAGDLFESKINLSNEAKLLAGELLNTLSNHCKEIIIVKGNHDLLSKSLSRKNSIETIVTLIDNPKITYLDKTDFYQDSYFNNIVWVNWDHIERGSINPWNNCNYTNDITKIYIDLYHDPVYGCKNDEGKAFISSTYTKSVDFLGTVGMFGDIHKRQFVGENKAFSGSLIQKDMGELPDYHGGIIWSINSPVDINYEFFDLPNDYSMVNLYLDQPDYDNLDLTIINPSKYIKCKVHWKDYASNIILDNELKIKEYLKNKYNIEKLKFDKQYIYTTITDSDKFTESIDITDTDIQQSIIKEYLTKNGYDEKTIEEIIKVDDIINSRLDKTEYKTNITWSIDKIWFNNFKSYGVDNNIDWYGKNGIIQIHGKNQEGKTTILDLITYVLYGSTLATNKVGGGKVEKFGDNRYINNKRKIDYCDGGMTINADGEVYTLYRRTERSWTKNKTLSSVSTNFDVYEGAEMLEEKKMTGQRKSLTQKRISTIIGEFEDFIRLALTNADNLNELLSLNRSTFLDNVLKDAGFDIFEKKNEILKDYKKEQSESKISLNVVDVKEEISTLNIDIETKNEEIETLTIVFGETNKTIKSLNTEKDANFKKLHNIDDSIANIDIDEINEAIDKYKSNINSLKLKFNANLTEVKTLNSLFDESKLNTLFQNKKEEDDKKTELTLSIAKIDNQISDHGYNISLYKNNIEQSKKDFVQSNLNKISEIKYKITDKENELKSIWKEKESELRSEYKDIETELSLKNLELKNIKDRGVELKKNIEDFKSSSVCPTCNREYDNIEDIKNHIEEETKRLNELFEKVKPIQVSIKKIEENKDKIAEKINSVIQHNMPDEFSDILENIQNIELNITKLNKNIDSLKSLNESVKLEQYTGELEDTITNELQQIESELKNIKILETIKKQHFSEIETIKELILNIEQEILELETIKEEVKRSEFLREENEKIKIQLENYKLQIANFNTKLELYNIQLNWIEENKETEKIIEQLKNSIEEETRNAENLNSKISQYKQEIVNNEHRITELNKAIVKYKEQERREELIKEYGKTIHRDGIPTYLLQKSIHLINNELTTLLTDVDFVVYFDENLNLKMSPVDRLDVVQNAIECSGKERTFIACALKLALRNVNNKSKPNFILFDEIMGKLIDNSVEEFIYFLSSAANKIEKIVIIEHVHPINYDYIIDVEKSSEGISKLSLN